MARKLASIVEIESCEPIPDTERLSVATMKWKGWKVVTGRDEFKPGDLCVYFEIDAALDPTDDRYSFLRERCLRKFVSKGGNVLREVIRIKTCKLRGVVSQGLLMPIGKFPELNQLLNEKYPAGEGAVREFRMSENGVVSEIHLLDAVPDVNGKRRLFVIERARILDWPNPEHPHPPSHLEGLVGEDVTELLHVEHYDEVKEQLQPAMGNPISADAMGKFPTAFCPKTDEPRLQGLTEYFDTMKGKFFEVTEKRDGASISFGYCPMIDAENPFMVCSRNLRLKSEKADGTVPMMWQTVRALGLDWKCVIAPNLMFQAEFCGMGVNGNADRLNEYTIEVFRVYDVEKQEFVEAMERRVLCCVMDIPHVPVIAPALDVFNRFHNIDEILPYADGKTVRGNPREGLVFKEVGTTHPISFKVVSNKYLLKQKD